MRGNAEEVQAILSNTYDLNYETLEEYHAGGFGRSARTGWCMSLIEKIDDYGAGGWSVAKEGKTEEKTLKKECGQVKAIRT